MDESERRSHPLKKIVSNLPESPGVYVLLDSWDVPLYVGKSRDLSDRVRHYFRPSVADRKTAHLRSLTKSIEFLCLGTDFQAREVEADLIRSYRPDYNTVYLDYMHRPLVKITTNEPFPRVRVVSEKNDEDARYFGPYRSTRRLRRILDILGDCFPFRTCEDDIPEGGRPEILERCHRARFNRCNAPCVGEDTVDEYQTRIDNLIEFLEGNHKPVLRYLNREMNRHARNHEYEAAGLIHEHKQAIEQLIEYEPFIRRTLDAEVVHRLSNPQGWGHVSIRDHRVQEFQVHRDTPANEAMRKDITTGGVDVITRCGLSEDPDYRSPQNDEEQQLVSALEATLNGYGDQPDAPSCVTDHVRFEPGTVRRTLGASDSHEMTLKGNSDDVRARLIEHYAHQIEHGVPVPDRITTDRDQPVEIDSILSQSRRRLTDSAPTNGAP